MPSGPATAFLGRHPVVHASTTPRSPPQRRSSVAESKPASRSALTMALDIFFFPLPRVSVFSAVRNPNGVCPPFDRRVERQPVFLHLIFVIPGISVVVRAAIPQNATYPSPGSEV